MPSLEADNHGVAGVAACAALLSEFLVRAEQVKQTTSIEPALTRADFGDISSQLATLFADYPPLEDGDTDGPKKGRQFAIIETAIRDLFGRLIATTPIDSPDFVKVWNLFDLLAIFSDEGECEAGLLFWLVEELLDSQTISGCRTIFDFLESRRERIIEKNFKAKHLIILRMCNELLRRLSRAEDTAFCGRVFIFLFQSFPLGDKSSVNLRGEYHVENITAYDLEVKGGDGGRDATGSMEVDTDATAREGSDPKAGSKAVSFNAKKPLDPDALYPIFWSLQESFSQPKKLFDAAHFTKFKHGLEATMDTFSKIQEEQRLRPSKTSEESKRGQKRKHSEGGSEGFTNAFNPKYLTSRDLFELEISDESFRRYVLIQALIIIDFLLSLGSKAREKLAGIHMPNKSVTYMDQLLNEEDTKWLTEMRRRIEHHITKDASSEGAYFYRMVETILSRDKHWARWKIENCPPIELEPVAPDRFLEAKKNLHRTTASKRARHGQVGSLSLDFLNDSDEQVLLEKLKSSERYEPPELHSFQVKISDDDFDIDSAKDSRSKALAVERKASKSWRALRIASRSRLAQFDRIDNQDKIDPIFEEGTETDDVTAGADEAADLESMPEDARPVVVSGPRSAGKTAVINALMEKHRGVFAKVLRHTSRARLESEAKSKEFIFVTSQTFNVMLDGDQFIEFKNFDGYDMGTNRKSVEAISEAGKVPLLELDREAVKMAKDMGFSARFVLVKPPSAEVLAERAKAAGQDETAVQALVEAAEAELQDPAGEQLFDSVITNEDVEAATKSIESYVFGKESEETNGTGDADQAMTDAPAADRDASQEETNGVAQ